MDKLRRKSGLFRHEKKEAEKQRSKEARTACQGLKDSLHPYFRTSLRPSLCASACPEPVERVNSACPRKCVVSIRKLLGVAKAFTLVEVLIVVAILGILAAVAIPLFEDNTQKAKESAAKEDLRVLRNAIELYAAKNKGIAPGYPENNTSSLIMNENTFYLAMLSKGYIYAKAKNPFNGLTTIKMIKNGAIFPETATGTFGWVYKPQTKTIKLDWPNTDSQGTLYFDY